MVCVWSIEDGEKIIQFSNAHGDSEITAMTFDQSKRRLITGARDGTVKIWNFNNGCCLRELEKIDDEEVNYVEQSQRGIFCARSSHAASVLLIGVGMSEFAAQYAERAP